MAEPIRVRRATSRAVFLVLAAICFASPISADDDVEFFEKRIRPIFVERCESCHSTKSGKTNGGLALDTRDGWMKGGESGSPVVPGKPDDSLLIRAVRYDENGPQMPPKEKGGKLPDVEIAALTEWITRGAPDPRVAKARVGGMTAEEVRTWWSFQPIRFPNPPTVNRQDWSHSDLDRFILAELEKKGIAPAEPADRRTFLRRVTYDLTGLPPTIDEIDSFINDSRPDASERLVDRLLASPAFGQRRARHWLDVARYADFYDANPKTRTAICELTEAWRYRDWVIDSLNSDLPYDQFVRHQISGDTIPNPSGEDVYPAGLIATTFLSNGVWDRGDADKEKIISDMADDNIDTVGKVFMGLTLGCARCHDHKFDPISTEDYYGLAGIFYSSHILEDMGAKGAEYVMNRVPLLPTATMTRRKESDAELKEVLAKLLQIDQLQRYQNLTQGGTPIVPSEFKSTAGAEGSIAADGVVLVSGNRAKDTYRLKAVAPDDGEIKFLRLETLVDSALPNQGPGRAGDGNFVVTRVAASFTTADNPEKSPTSIRWASARADIEQNSFPAANAIDDKPESGWAIDPHEGRNHVIVFEVWPETRIPPGALMTIEIEQTHSEQHTLGKFRLSVANQLVPPETPSNPDKPQLIETRNRLQKELSVPVPLAMAVTEGGMKGGLFPNIQDVPIHIRGHYGKLGQIVPRRFPKFLAGENQPPIAQGSGRKELGEWVTSNTNPLTARVIVNRIWQWHFGEGLVRTTSNFGKLGEPPSHPELLDWMATKLKQDGWSLKRLHRRILDSATYQLTSRVTREELAKDPENRWFGRFSPRRLEAEAIRDAMLSVSGQLDESFGGPAGDDFTIMRRSLYVQTARWDRSGYAILFDAANPDSSVERRITSTVAPQALLFLNHEFLADRSRQLADRVSAEVPNDEAARIRRMYQLLFGRDETDEELKISRTIVQSGAEPLSGWIDLAHVLFCSNEFVYVD